MTTPTAEAPEAQALQSALDLLRPPARRALLPGLRLARLPTRPPGALPLAAAPRSAPAGMPEIRVRCKPNEGRMRNVHRAPDLPGLRRPFRPRRGVSALMFPNGAARAPVLVRPGARTVLAAGRAKTVADAPPRAAFSRNSLRRCGTSASPGIVSGAVREESRLLATPGAPRRKALRFSGRSGACFPCSLQRCCSCSRLRTSTVA